MFNLFSRSINKVRQVGLGFVLETLFDRFVPSWLFRYCGLAIYQLDAEKLESGRLPEAVVTVCQHEQEIKRLSDLTGNEIPQTQAVGAVAKIDEQVIGGLWTASGEYRDHDLGLSFLLSSNEAWVYGARVEPPFRRRGIYSRLMAVAAEDQKQQGRNSLLIGVSELNRGSRKAIERVGSWIGGVVVIRVGWIVWAWPRGAVSQDRYLTFRCSRQPIEITCRGSQNAVAA